MIPSLVLAPMDGITDAVYRELLTSRVGGIDLCVSEFVRVNGEPVPAHVLAREVPELLRGGRTRGGVPVAVQLLGGRPEPMAITAMRAAELGAYAIDLNFGCPAKTVNNHDGGATLLQRPCRIAEVVGAVRAAVPSAIPVSAKVRLGWDSAANIVDIARAAEAGGASWLTIHARTRTQLYAPPVDWAAIGRARAAIAIPVIANGDLCTPADLERCAAVSGCSSFMIGRAAMADPWIFRRVRGEALPAFDRQGMHALLVAYVEMLIAAGVVERSALARLKQWLRFAAAMHEPMAHAFAAVKTMGTLGEGVARLAAALAEPLRLTGS
jgi:tRNA-dihydrouridine synthase C